MELRALSLLVPIVHLCTGCGSDTTTTLFDTGTPNRLDGGSGDAQRPLDARADTAATFDARLDARNNRDVAALVDGGTRAWRMGPSGTISARYGTTVAFDSDSGRVIAFGGSLRGAYMDDTWALADDVWTQIQTTTSPPPRASARMAYDSTRNRIVLFGGWSVPGPTYFQDTWAFDGHDWVRLAGSVAPPGRRDHSLTYDETRDRMVLFGGTGAGSQWFADTWEFDGTDWIQVATSNVFSRYEHAATYDPMRGGVIRFGGWNNRAYGDTWEYDGRAWTEVSTNAGPSARIGATLAFDPSRGGSILHGGDSGQSTYYRDTWLLRDAQWTQIASDGPRGLAQTMVYDDQRNRLIWIGGPEFGPLATWYFE